MTHNTPIKTLVVFGTRPEAIKLAPVIQALREDPAFAVRVCVTAQHRQMLDQVLELFAITPDVDLNLMAPDQTLTHVTCSVLAGMERILRAERPDWVIVQGDTTTTMAGALAAFYQKVAVAHVEAGLRTWDIYAPWPEEMNRQLTSMIARLHFPPTAGAATNLRAHGVPADRIVVSGNTVIDALFKVVDTVRHDLTRRRRLDAQFAFLEPARRLILVTGHRRENFGAGFERVCQALRALSERDDVTLLYPVHLNPNVQEPVRRILGNRSNVHLVDPQDYLPFVYLMDRASLIITDSGGVQEEAPALGKPVLVTRDKTERPEAVEAGTVELVGTDTARIVAAATRLLDDPVARERMTRAHSPYGDGQASVRIRDALRSTPV